jgi:hypothetical protein
MCRLFCLVIAGLGFATLLLAPAVRAEETGSISAPAASLYSMRFYGEALTLESEGGYSAMSSAKALRALRGPLSLYIGTQIEAYEPDQGRIKRIAPLGGLEADFRDFRLFAEYRYEQESPRSPYSHNDPRFGLTGGHWAEFEFLRKLSLFSDTYGELVQIPRINWNPTALAFSKAGLRLPLQKSLFLDSYLEAYYADSADPAFGRRALESRSGLRLAYWHNGWGAQISGFRRFATLAPAPDARWRSLVSVGGAF